MTVVSMSYVESFYVLLENHITLIVCNCLFVILRSSGYEKLIRYWSANCLE